MSLGEVLSGIVGLDGVFRRLGLGGIDACGVRGVAGPVLVGARVFIGRTQAQARTVVNGVAGAGVRSVTVVGPGGARRLRLGPEGSFITVYAGYVEDVRPRVVVVDRDGHSDTIDLARSDAFQAADPAGGAPWDVTGGADFSPGAAADEECTQLQRQSSPPEPGVSAPTSRLRGLGLFGAQAPEVCGRLALHPVFVAMQRFVPNEGHVFWNDSPARTIVYGAAAPRVASLTLSISGRTPTPVTIDRADGAFGMVLDGRQRPSALVLTAHLLNGTTLTFRHSADLFTQGGQPTTEPPAPPYRSPAPLRPLPEPRFARPIASTVREQLHSRDPAGGPEWALKSWQSPSTRFGGGRPSGRLESVEAGVLSGGRLMQPTLTGKPAPLEAGQQFCSPQQDAPFIYGHDYLSDPITYAPTPDRVVITGFVPRDAIRASLIGAGFAEPVALDGNRAFLSVLPGRFWDTSIRISAVLADGRTVTSRYGTNAPSDLGGLNVGAFATAPDPDGGPPWGFRAGNHSEIDGQVLDNRFISMLPSALDGEFQLGPDSSQGGTALATRPSPLALFTDNVNLSALSSAAITPAEIERRTLPGRTLIAGLAAPDVVSVTLTTPRDIRTLQPTGRHHAFIAVYDGFFYNSPVTATALLRDGRTITKAVAGADYPSPGEFQATISPQKFLAQLNQAHDRLTSISRLPARYRRQEALSYKQQIKAVTARIAYARSHSGLLPPD